MRQLLHLALLACKSLWPPPPCHAPWSRWQLLPPGNKTWDWLPPVSSVPVLLQWSTTSWHQVQARWTFTRQSLCPWPPYEGALLECGQGWWWHGNTERGEGEFSLMYQASILILVSSKANNYISILGFAFDVVQYPPHLETNVHRSLFYLDKLLKINLPKSSSWYCR